jgi:hypothetical protein
MGEVCPQALRKGGWAGQTGNCTGNTVCFACFLTNYLQTKQM